MLDRQIALMKHMYELQLQLTATTHQTIVITKEMAVVLDELRGHMADFEDVLEANSELLLLGKALLRYPTMLVVEVDI